MSKTSTSLSILLYLWKNGKMSAEQLASLLELSDRSIRKHIDDLLLAGFPINSVRGRNGGYYLESNPLWNGFLSAKDLDKLADLVKKQLAIEPNNSLLQHLKNTLEKLSKQEHTVVMSSHTLNSDTNYIEHIKEKLQYCLQKRVKAIIQYHSSSSGVTSRVIHVYHFIQYDSQEYCIAYCERRMRFLTFKLNRIEHILLSEQKFIKDSSFSVHEFIGTNSLFNDAYKLEMLVKSEIYIWFRDTNWAFDQEVVRYNEEYYLFTGTMYGLPQIMQFILRFGSNVILLSPNHIKLKIEEEIRKMEKINKIFPI
ncbi:WYL domain-containing protein [Ectobacillus antri]|uniref:WYL domain-containing protein n=1 Tax=Ectobacillus antri TaxID=2486280 RepID=A0ABT6HAC2_9BACI|nr:WYL domain-containing protein [Ectobacillus antri]MDG4656925.1 WYL domain-containing protein [Ectobacillus antri]MDG5755637.1 WYL domain-containing protein [Ectobacillus antri]